MSAGTIVVIGIYGFALLAIAIAVFRAGGGADGGPGNGGGGGGVPRRPQTPPAPPDAGDPPWWPQFEREFAAYLAAGARRDGRADVPAAGAPGGRRSVRGGALVLVIGRSVREIDA
jgi:hypothetical protein